MCGHFLHPHLTPGKPIFHPGHFFFEIQTGAHHTQNYYWHPCVATVADYVLPLFIIGTLA